MKIVKYIYVRYLQRHIESVELPHLPVGCGEPAMLESSKYTDMSQSPPHTAELLSGHGTLQTSSSLFNE